MGMIWVVTGILSCVLLATFFFVWPFLGQRLQGTYLQVFVGICGVILALATLLRAVAGYRGPLQGMLKAAVTATGVLVTIGVVFPLAAMLLNWAGPLPAALWPLAACVFPFDSADEYLRGLGLHYGLGFPAVLILWGSVVLGTARTLPHLRPRKFILVFLGVVLVITCLMHLAFHVAGVPFEILYP